MLRMSSYQNVFYVKDVIVSEFSFCIMYCNLKLSHHFEILTQLEILLLRYGRYKMFEIISTAELRYNMNI